MPGYSRILSWSGGNDAAFVLDEHHDALLTTYDEGTAHLPHTQVMPLDAALAQSDSLGLPVVAVPIPSPGDAPLYAERMREAVNQFSPRAHIDFGDLILDDLRADREAALKRAGFCAQFPGWSVDSADRRNQITEAGIGAVVVSLDTRVRSPDLLGQSFDASFAGALTAGVDPCRQRGEFQTFVLNHPRFSFPIPWHGGDIVHEGDFAMLRPHMLWQDHPGSKPAPAGSCAGAARHPS
ncbi:hypothetical protein [Nocardioides sp. Soil805]|uniref:Dph6-related ATP pyrophosphatase n=1 Tax=Nocardioides sp. Soil805 TaxID=1736416 RepID=UPI00070282A3|nr:hypothetical protein [Nocardioides sp. Soil805]KRF32265.1 hypothetical protein ASG94_17425 [Nocardioides sp. Soil805]